MRKFFGTWYFVLVAVSEKIRTADPTPPTGELSLCCLDRGVDTDVRGGWCLTRYVVSETVDRCSVQRNNI